MLSVKPSQRPTIVDILNKPFVRKRVQAYVEECINGVNAQDLSPTDVDDMNIDSLREQAEKLNILYAAEDGGAQAKGKPQPLN